jgi:DNA sulfur modification protein DndD
MVVFTSITIENFKRFTGVHQIPLSGDGPITVIAAENGVGKTTVLDAFYLALHGKKGIQMRKNESDFNFEEWLSNAFSSTAELNSGYMMIRVKLEMDSPEMGLIAVDRKYWVHPESHETNEELNLHIDGTILKIEVGEKKEQVIRAWIEALIPPAITQRFLIDGEKLGSLNVRHLGESMKNGLDDLLGQGVIHRLQAHLKSVERRTIAEIAPEHERESLVILLHESEIRRQRADELQDDIQLNEHQLESLIQRQNELQDLLQQRSSEEGSHLGKLRIDFAISSSEIAQIRKQLIEHLVARIPFYVGGMTEELEKLGYSQAKENLKSSMIETEVFSSLEAVLSQLQPQLSQDDEQRVLDASAEQLRATISSIPSSFRFLNNELMEQFTTQYFTHSLNQSEEIESELQRAALKIQQHREIISELSAASRRVGMAETAELLLSVSVEIGELRANNSHMHSEIISIKAEQSQTDLRVKALQGAASADSEHRKVVELIQSLVPILSEYAAQRRDQLAKPLSKEFSSGFELLSRKSNLIEKIEVDSSSYDVQINMKGFSGNWLDRDLSATEKQHVGLSLLYALRRLASKPLPVVVDTPTSRMDIRHKGYSVTKFYPNLSHQVIVLATSDDLAGGLHKELKKANAFGQQVLLKENGPARIKVITGDLKSFF